MVETKDYIENWFKDYTSSFYGDDDDINTNIRLKVLHTAKVVAETERLTGELGLCRQDRDIAAVIAYLHDCGRFAQLVKYKTFDDKKSENHALLGLKVIEQEKLIDRLGTQTQLIIREAVRNHNAKSVRLAENAPPQTLMFTKIIRDTDKLDIFRVVQASYEQYLREPDKANNIAVNFGTDTGQCSSEVFDALIYRRQADYSKLETLDDRKLLQLCWLYDINYTHTLKKIIERGYVDMIYKALPETEQMEKVKTIINQYIKEVLPDFDLELTSGRPT